MLATCMCQNWRSRARGVEDMENVIPMLGGDYFFVIPMLRGSANSVFFNTPAARMLEHGQVAAFFYISCENELPALRGDHILDVDVQ